MDLYLPGAMTKVIILCNTHKQFSFTRLDGLENHPLLLHTSTISHHDVIYLSV